MTFLVLVTDRPGMEDKREIARPEHRAYLSGFGSKLLVSGALMADDNKTIVGGASLIDVAAYEDAQAFAHNDPYALAGIRDRVDILRWRLRWWVGAFDPEGFFKAEI